MSDNYLPDVSKKTSTQLSQMPEENKYALLRKRRKIYITTAIISGVVSFGSVFVFTNWLSNIPIFICLGALVICMIGFILVGIASVRQKSVYKSQFTDAIASEVFNWTPYTSAYLARSNHFQGIFRTLQLASFWTGVEITTSIVGEVRNHKIGYLTFNLYHDVSRGRSSERVTDYIGQLFILPIVNTTTNRPFRIYLSDKEHGVYTADTRFDIRSKADMFRLLTGRTPDDIDTSLPEVELLYFDDQLSDSFIEAIDKVYKNFATPTIAFTDKLLFIVIPCYLGNVLPFAIHVEDENSTADLVKARLRDEAEMVRGLFEIFMDHEIY